MQPPVRRPAADVPTTLSLLTALTTLSLDAFVCPRSWSTDTWAAKLACLR